MLGTLGKEQKANWKDFVAPVVHAYNATKHESTGVSPFYLMFGRHPRLTIDVQFGHDPNGFPRKKHSVFVDDLRKRLDYAYKLAKVKAKSSAERQKKTYDGRKPTSNKLSPGDKVLVKNVTPKGKLDNFWEDDIYIVVAKLNEEIPVYQIQREDGKGRDKPSQEKGTIRRFSMLFGSKSARHSKRELPKLGHSKSKERSSMRKEKGQSMINLSVKDAEFKDKPDNKDSKDVVNTKTAIGRRASGLSHRSSKLGEMVVVAAVVDVYAAVVVVVAAVVDVYAAVVVVVAAVVEVYAAVVVVVVAAMVDVYAAVVVVVVAAVVDVYTAVVVVVVAAVVDVYAAVVVVVVVVVVAAVVDVYTAVVVVVVAAVVVVVVAAMVYVYAAVVVVVAAVVDVYAAVVVVVVAAVVDVYTAVVVVVVAAVVVVVAAVVDVYAAVVVVAAAVVYVYAAVVVVVVVAAVVDVYAAVVVVAAAVVYVYAAVVVVVVVAAVVYVYAAVVVVVVVVVAAVAAVVDVSLNPSQDDGDDKSISGMSLEGSGDEDMDEDGVFVLLCDRMKVATVFSREVMNDSDFELKEEADAWSLTVDKKILKKMTAKDIKRQDVIHELIQTEEHYVRTLKIMFKIFYSGMTKDLHLPKETVNCIFPQIEELLEMHSV
ncbi:hypothetical protein QZH41_015962 [Actinostola sp. cb2023]|nr:hypothetical protein QZH41_015962 [Actinostola sp. cb2023]